MIEIRPLNPVIYEDIHNLGFNGFITDRVFKLRENKSDESIIFSLECMTLSDPYKKEWHLSHNAIESMNETIKEGLSFGAYDKDTLLGFVLATRVKWNNSLWLENLRVSEDHRGQGIAKRLLEDIETFAKNKAFRLIGLEVMGSNVPAIELYKKLDYVVDGFDRSHYPTRHGGQKEIAVFMKRYIAEHI